MKKPSEIILKRAEENINENHCNETHAIVLEILKWLDDNLKIPSIVEDKEN